MNLFSIARYCPHAYNGMLKHAFLRFVGFNMRHIHQVSYTYVQVFLQNRSSCTNLCTIEHFTASAHSRRYGLHQILQHSHTKWPIRFHWRTLKKALAAVRRNSKSLMTHSQCAALMDKIAMQRHCEVPASRFIETHTHQL